MVEVACRVNGKPAKAYLFDKDVPLCKAKEQMSHEQFEVNYDTWMQNICKSVGIDPRDLEGTYA